MRCKSRLGASADLGAGSVASARDPAVASAAGSIAVAEGAFIDVAASAARDADSSGVSARGVVEVTGPAKTGAVSSVILRFLSASKGENAGLTGSAGRAGADGLADAGRAPADCGRGASEGEALGEEEPGNLLSSS